jgi:hypothetical protein
MTESLRSRREAALLGLSFKLLDGAGRGALQEFAPILSVSYPDFECKAASHGQSWYQGQGFDFCDFSELLQAQRCWCFTCCLGQYSSRSATDWYIEGMAKDQ